MIRARLPLLLALVLLALPPVAHRPAEDPLIPLATRAIELGYQHDAKELRATLQKLEAFEPTSHRVDYWRGFVHMRLAEIATFSAGIDVETYVDAAVSALESAVAAQDDFADGYALLAHMNDWQMMFHHENKRAYADRTEAFLARAKELDATNPRVLLFQGLDLANTPVMYGGSPERAVDAFHRALELFDDPHARDVGVEWGVIDAYLALGDVQLDRDELEEAGHAYTAASELAPESVRATRGLAAVTRRERLRLGPALASEPIPAPIDRAHGGWPFWRGPSRSGAVTDDTWTNNGVELWRRSVGLGYSGVTVANGRLFTKGYDVETASDVVYALDAMTGKELWRVTYPAAIWNDMHTGGTLSTPVVDEGRVYAMNREGRMHCIDATDGTVLWERELVNEEALETPRWGFAASPLVLGDQLILNVGRIVSLDKHSGARLWRTRHYGDAYSTPTPFEQNDVPYLAAFVAEGLVILDPRTGKEQALHAWRTQYDQNCASPLLVADGIFVSSGMGRGCALLSFDGTGLSSRWSGKSMRNTMSASVTDGTAIYGFDSKVLRCMTTTGEPAWTERGAGWGALTLAGDRLVAVTDGGDLLIAQATPECYVELARERVFEEGKGWTAPVCTGGRLYLRSSEGELVCRDHRTD